MILVITTSALARSKRSSVGSARTPRLRVIRTAGWVRRHSFGHSVENFKHEASSTATSLAFGTTRN